VTSKSVAKERSQRARGGHAAPRPSTPKHKTYFFRADADLVAALAQLAKADPRFAGLMERAGPPSLRRRPAGFAGLCAIICSQQLSIASAAAIWSRVSGAFEPFEPAALARARAAKLARLGLSRPKIKTLKAIGSALAKGTIDLDALALMEADAAHAALVSLHGVGPWTADIYLLFCLGHADTWPAGDLALQEAARMAFALKQRPSVKDMLVLAEPWRPWRGAAAHILWSYYRAMKKREGVLAATRNARPA
jgi:DNA-3-methyladenine glycosylase II